VVTPAPGADHELPDSARPAKPSCRVLAREPLVDLIVTAKHNYRWSWSTCRKAWTVGSLPWGPS
jgi:hypothetical protein